MLYIFLLAILLLPQWPGVERSLIIKRCQFSIHGLTIGSTENDIVTILGKPKKLTEPRIDEPTGLLSRDYIYTGLEIFVVGGEIYNIRCTCKKYKTFNGIRVGNSIEDIKKSYGNAEVENKHGSTFICFFPEHIDGSLIFYLKNGKVSEIELFYDYV